MDRETLDIIKALDLLQTKPKGTSFYECLDEVINGKRETYKIELEKGVIYEH